jgi:O-antigen/teichoic acid export membrane protein
MGNSVNRFQQTIRECLTGLYAWRSGRLPKGTLAMTAGMGLRTIAQASVFLIVARVLGVEAYGAYAAVLTIAGALGSFGGSGAQILMLRDAVCDPERFPEAWRRGLAAIALSAHFLLGIYLTIAWAVLPGGISWAAIVLIGLSELLFAPLAQAGVSAYQGYERICQAARLLLVPVLYRLCAALMLLPLALVLPARMQLAAWSALYALAALLAATYAVLLVHRDLGLPLRPDAEGLVNYLREGIPFAFGSAAQKLYVDIDKVMLARLTTLEATGAYSAGYRVVDMMIIPLWSILAAAVPRFFRAGNSGTGSAVVYALRLLPLPIAYALGSAVVLHFMGGLLPQVLGAGYAEAVNVLQYLAWLPLVSTPRLFLQVALSTSGRQGTVVGVLMAGAILNILLNFWFIPYLGWQGAVVSTYAAEVFISLLIIGLITANRKHFAENCFKWRTTHEKG